ncbi:PREDICTED: uncharacterized protein LOC104805448 [Tarenaya hassleriana]|uniref:uncharacterized protein LOC104805448 n=1 Tax=Tarenaya hassleriana TaxID=28532 RepID=UPI00053C64A9|nr:PREDICTED: uncharacterized protein LOC104805448 [Tarenaya hassleriana]
MIPHRTPTGRGGGAFAAASVVALLLLLSPAACSAPIPGLDSFLTQQFHVDPKASNDSFGSLPSSLKRSLSSSSSPLHLPSLLQSLLSLSVSVSLHVRFVGDSFPSSAASTFSSFLSAAVSDDNFHVISPSPDSASNHRLTVSHSLHLDASLSPPSLSSRLDATLKTLIAGTTSSLRSQLLSVPYGPIDEIVRHEYEKEKHGDGGVYIYLISLGSQSKPYAYSYTDGDSSPGFTKCSGSIWTGKERYLWIDLSAGPVDYGPALSGDGVLPRGEFHPLAAFHGRPKSQKALLADLASLVYNAYQVLIVPSLRIPVYFEDSLVVQFVHIYGTEHKDPSGLDWEFVKRTFMDEVNNGGLLLGEQKLSFKSYSVNYRECPLCSFAVSRATNSYTSRFLFDNYTLIVNEYLDSKHMHRTLSESAEELKRVAGIHEEEGFARVLPVYVFDLDINMPLLIDRYHQSVAFRDMVIAVRTRGMQTVSDYTCNGRHVFVHTRDLERPLVGSILQSMWGVSPTHLTWSPRHNSTLVDYTWSVGQTPFGPFSDVSSLSFVQKDAAKRNILLTSLNATISSAIDILDSVMAHGGDRNLLRQNRNTEFIQRWSLFKYKLEKTVSALSHFDFEMALFYLRSLDHDLYSMHSIVYMASQEIEASLNCFKDPPFPWGPVTVSGLGLMALVYVYSRRDKLFRSKRKQF